MLIVLTVEIFETLTLADEEEAVAAAALHRFAVLPHELVKSDIALGSISMFVA